MVISQKALHNFRADTFRLHPNRRLHTAEDAAAFVKERGFVYFWPITGITFPSLWAAVAGNRRVADAHDDPGHVTWGWKDDALGKRVWYYGKILRKKATMIDLDIAPYFYALSENYDDDETDARVAASFRSKTRNLSPIFATASIRRYWSPKRSAYCASPLSFGIASPN